MGELKKMELGEIPMTEEGKRRLAELKEMGASFRAALNAAQNAVSELPKVPQISIPQLIPTISASEQVAKSIALRFQTNQGAVAKATSSIATNIEKFQESMRPFIQQMAEALKVTRVIDSTAREVYENEKDFHEKFGPKIRGYDTFWYWLCDELDRRMFENSEERIRVDYEIIVDYYSTFIGQQAARRKSNVDAVQGVKTTANIVSEDQIERRASNSENEIVEIRSINKERKKKEQPNIYNTFAEIFVNPNDLSEYIEVLRKVAKKNNRLILTDDNHWIERQGNLSILIAWVDALKQRGKLKSKPPFNDKILANLLNKQFPGLNFDIKDPSILRKLTNTRNKYHPDFLQLIK